MKKVIISILLIFFALPSFAVEATIIKHSEPEAEVKPLECEITFDWISKTQLQRDENIKQIQDILFNEKTVLKYPRKEFRTKNAEFLKDKDSMQNYMDISNGKKEDADKYYGGFFLKGGILYAYGVQYKNNLKNIYYYSPLGSLIYIETYSENYPKLPYYSLQYDTNGKLIGTIYYVNAYDQYIYNPNKSFKGRWYKEKMYNRNAKVILTRSNY